MTLEYEPYELEDGTVLQSGISSPDEEQAPAPHQTTYGYISRAVVLQTYYTDDAGWANMMWKGAKGVYVDARLFGKRSRTLYRIPVCQGSGGLWDEDTYIPRPAAVNIAGGQLVTDSSPTGSKPTEAHNMDGDHILVGFLECDPLQPIAFPFAMPHPSTNKDYKEADGRVRRIRHNGVLIEWDKDGNLTIDASEAAQASLTNSGKEISNSGTAGKIKILTNDGTDESSIELDHQGGVIFTDGGGDTIKMTKAGKLVDIDAGATFTAKGGTAATVEGGSTLTLKGPATTIDATATLTATSPVVTFNASATFTVTSAAITLGSGAVPVCKHTPWVSAWTTMIATLATQIATYNAVPPPGVVAVADYKKLLQDLNAVAGGYAAIATLITKAA